jgi:hypothetical protein
MPQPVKVRADYRNDSAFLLRFEAAVGLDTRHSPLWKKIVQMLARALVQMVLDDSERGLEEAAQGLTRTLPQALLDAQERGKKSAR